MVIQSLSRGLRILEVVAIRSASAPLASICSECDLHRSTAHHLLQTLVGRLQLGDLSLGHGPGASPVDDRSEVRETTLAPVTSAWATGRAPADPATPLTQTFLAQTPCG